METFRVLLCYSVSSCEGGIDSFVLVDLFVCLSFFCGRGGAVEVEKRNLGVGDFAADKRRIFERSRIVGFLNHL